MKRQAAGGWETSMLLSRRSQAFIIRALLDGRAVDVEQECLSGVWREYYAWIRDGPEGETSEERWQGFFQDCVVTEEDQRNYRAIKAAGTECPYEAIDACLAGLPELEWLWPGWIARQQLTLLVGDPGVGKSYQALDLARRVAGARGWPDGREMAGPGVVLYVDAENRPAIFKRRIEPWSYEQRRRLFYMLPGGDRSMIDLESDMDRERFLDRMYHLRPGLVVIDSYGSISLKGENSKEDVQRVLGLLIRVARDYDCAIVAVHHLRKRAQYQMSLPVGGEISLHSVKGSGYILQMATNILGLSLVGSDRNGVRSLHVIKNNIGLHPEPIGVTFSPWEGNPEVAVLSYGEVPEVERERPKIEECMRWLVEMLEVGPLAPREAVEMGEEEGYSRRTVYRARKRLGDRVRNTLGRQAPENQWQLVEDEGE